MNYYQLLIFFLILFFHSFILNPQEKRFFSELFPESSIVQRPSKKCKNQLVLHEKCLGLPSGSAEIATIIAVLLYYYQILSLPVAICLIAAVSMQRILTKKHTLLQVIVGILFGLFYSSIYVYLFKNVETK
jgi:membrane-associated phospholipid phosphatase